MMDGPPPCFNEPVCKRKANVCFLWGQEEVVGSMRVLSTVNDKNLGW